MLARVPPHQRRPAELVAAACARAAHARAIFGPIELHELGDVASVWRPLIGELSRQTDLTWAGEALPAWLQGAGVALRRPAPVAVQSRKAVSCATPYHEALEALRWARRLLATRDVPAHHIAIVAAAPERWDDYFVTLSESAHLPVRFVHWRPALSTPAGQLCAALAEVLLRGLSRARMVRLVALLRERSAPFGGVPADWHAALPETAPLFDVTGWVRAIDALPSTPESRTPDARPVLRDLVHTLRPGIVEAQHIGERLLEGSAHSLWDRALIEAPAAALDTTFSRLRVDDGLEPEASIVWGPASTLAACPRPYAWLLGLTARAWPRTPSEDPLLPAHVVAPERLSPAPRPARDRADFHTFWNRTAHQLVCSRTRSDATGRRSAASPLYPTHLPELHLRAGRAPRHGLTPSDRLLGRPAEFESLPRARAARACWRNWHRPQLTPHDGLMRPGHPLLLRALSQVHSPTSLTTLLTNPLGFLWRTGFGCRVPEDPPPCLILEPRLFGTLFHEIHALAVRRLERHECGGLGDASRETVAEAVETATHDVAARWARERPLPPFLVWQRQCTEAAALAIAALDAAAPPLHAQRSWCELRFGAGARAQPLARAALPWDTHLEVVLPGARLRVGGYIDRLDLSGDSTLARITEYKTTASCGSAPVLGLGAKLQRALYAFAVHTLVPTRPRVETRLVHLRRGQQPQVLADTDVTLEHLSRHLAAAASSFADGFALAGPGAGERHRCTAFALAASATQGYLERKAPAIAAALGALAPPREGR